MASEILAVPEEHLEKFCRVLEAGMEDCNMPRTMRAALKRWIKQERVYLKLNKEEK